MIECANFDNDEGETPTFFTERTVHKARTTHFCCECKQPIHKGEGYMREVGQWDGKFTTYKTCLHCLSIRRAFFDRFVFGDVLADLKECFYDSDGRFNENAMKKLTTKGFEMVEAILSGVWERLEENGY